MLLVARSVTSTLKDGPDIDRSGQDDETAGITAAAVDADVDDEAQPGAKPGCGEIGFRRIFLNK